MEPKSIAHFDVLGRLGAGGMGVVYKARDRVLGREVALKLVRPEHASDPGARERLLREARAAAVLSHPGIATVYEAGEATPDEPGATAALYIAEELVEGETLAERLRRGPLDTEDVLRLGAQMADALGEAHARGVVHRDVKPSNLMLTPDGRVKVLDFGLARRHVLPVEPPVPEAETWSRSAPGLIVGTPAYMAPEQITGERVDARADVYSAGCVLYELLAGRPPFAGASAAEVLRRSLTETPRPIEQLRRDVPALLATAVTRALARDPHERYADGRELASALRPAAAAPSTAEGHAPAPSGRHDRAARAAGLVLGSFTLAALAWLVFERSARPALAFKERDFILVADVANGTEEPVFDLALKSAIETDLRQSRYVNVFDATQVQNTLRLMRLPPDTRVDERVGRDVCRRAGVRALIVPRILRAGEAYQVGATLVEPASGRVVDELRVAARGREQVLLQAIDGLTRDLRTRLGESIGAIARTDPPFAQYTTSSLEALDLLDRGRRAWGLGDHAKAERCFREALQHDPRFAAARGSLGLELIQFLDRPEEGRTLLAQALEEADQVSEREYLHLRALNKQFVARDLDGALDDYRFISELYPDAMPPFNNSGQIYAQLGRLEEAAAMYDRAHAADPRSLVPLWNLWFLCAQRLKDPARAEQAGRALVTLLPDNAHAAHAVAFSLVAQRRFAEAEEGMRATLKLDPVHPYALPNLAHLLFRRGAAAEAVTVYREAARLAREGRIETGLEHLDLSLGLALAAAGDTDASRSTILDAAARLRRRARKAASAAKDQALLAALLASAGRRDEARSLADRAAHRAGHAVDVHYELARAFTALGDPVKARSHLEQAYAAGYTDPYFALIDPALGELREDPILDRLAPRGST